MAERPRSRQRSYVIAGTSAAGSCSRCRRWHDRTGARLACAAGSASRSPGYFAIGLAYMLWNAGIAALGGARTAVYQNFTPVVAAAFAWLTLGERWTAASSSGPPPFSSASPHPPACTNTGRCGRACGIGVASPLSLLEFGVPSFAVSSRPSRGLHAAFFNVPTHHKKTRDGDRPKEGS